MTAKRIIVIFTCVSLLLGTAGLSGCISYSGGGAQASFENTPWILDKYGTNGNMKSVLRGTLITVVFRSGEKHFGGSDGCNNYGGPYEITGSDGLNIEGIMSTLVLCGESVIKQANAYKKILGNATNFQVDHRTLTITGPEGTLVFKG